MIPIPRTNLKLEKIQKHPGVCKNCRRQSSAILELEKKVEKFSRAIPDLGAFRRYFWKILVLEEKFKKNSGQTLELQKNLQKPEKNFGPR